MLKFIIIIIIKKDSIPIITSVCYMHIHRPIFIFLRHEEYTLEGNLQPQKLLINGFCESVEVLTYIMSSKLFHVKKHSDLLLTGRI